MEKVKCTFCGEENKTNARYCFRCGYELPKVEIESTVNPSKKVEKKEKLNKNNLVGTVVGIIAFALASFAVQQVFFKPASFDKVMMKAASEINESCPIMVDEATRLDNAIALPDNSFQYNYTLVDMVKSEINLDSFKKELEPNLINFVKTDPNLKINRENKITMIYNYRDKNGEFLIKFLITPDLYQ